MAEARPLPALPEGWIHRTPRRSYAEGAQRRGSVSWLHALWVLTRHEFRSRYRAQALGVVWSLLYPVVMMGILSVIFGRVFRSDDVDYPIFALIGIIFWQFVSRALNSSTTAFIGHAEIIKRTIFPRQLLPLAVMLSFGINFLVESMVLFIFIPVFPHSFKLSWALLLLPVVLGFLVLCLAGVALAMSVLNVIYRDLAYLVEIGLMILYWLTPVIYRLDRVPEPYQAILKGSPLTGVVNALRNIIMLGQPPSLLCWASMVAPSLVIFGIGWLIFRRWERTVLDYV